MTSARFTRRITLILGSIALLAAIMLAPARAQAVDAPRLAHKPTGLTIAAPKGYSLTQANGYYTLKGKGSFAVFASGVSPLTVPATGAALIAASKGKVLGKATSTAKLYRATVVSGKRIYVLTVRASGTKVSIALIGPGAPPKLTKANDARLVQLSATQLRQVAALDAIVRSRRGGADALVNVAIPMRLAATLDNLASANVPATPGWVVDGGNGIFAVTHPELGFGWFGLTIAALTPDFPFSTASSIRVTPSADPGENLVQVLPQYFTKTLNHTFALGAVQKVEGSDGLLGPTIPSALYEARFTWQGKSMQALILWGTLNNVSGLLNSYMSLVAISDTAPGSYSNALLQTWASANGEAGFRERLSTTLERLADRPDRQFILTPSRFRSDASTWISLLASGAR